MIQSAYVHVPFCNHICAYCDFFRSGYNALLADQWLNVICDEIKAKKLPKLSTLYIGGGTPTALSETQLERLLQALDHARSESCEYTMEANLSSLSDTKLAIMKKHGINRISLGVQSFQDHLLAAIGRTHRQADIEPCLKRIHSYDIHNISIDLIYGLPDQTLRQWQEDLSYAISLPITHISIYSLTIEPNSQFGRAGIQPADENLDAQMYEYACQYLNAHGFIQYEISSFAKGDARSRHNLAYWNYDDFYGIGCGASGKEAHIRYDNTRRFDLYFTQGADPDQIVLSKRDEMFEMIMMSLRKKEGMSRALFQARFHRDVCDVYPEAIETNRAKGYLQCSETHLFATETGYPLLHEILIEFL